MAPLTAIQSFIDPEMSAVDQIISARLESPVPLIKQVSEYIINSGGKRVRPALVLLSAGTFGYTGRHHYVLAAVVDLIHTATLLHDDVVDDSSLRRGNASANVLFGNAASVLVGDFLYSRAFQMMLEVENDRIMRILADASNAIAEGEVLQLFNCHNPQINEANYLTVIQAKTAKLFEAAAHVGAILGNTSAANEKIMAQYGMHVGTAFQLIDDILDYSGDQIQIGKNIGDDLAEGKPTLPLIYAMQNGTAEQSKIIRDAIIKGGLTELNPVLDAIHQTGALEYVRLRARQEVEAATNLLLDLPYSESREYLLGLAEFIVSRNY